MFKLNNSWAKLLESELNSSYFENLIRFLEKEYVENSVFPKKSDVFRALNMVRPDYARVVILGQDPYHGEGEANGLCFSVDNGTKIPPSLRNIFKELEFQTGVKRQDTDLSDWANQGIILLNTTLTVQKDKANSHEKIGWTAFTDRVIEILGNMDTPVVFVLWGKNARAKRKLIKGDKHLILESAHPSPLSAHRGFFGNNHFVQINEFLVKNKQNPIKW